MKPDVPGVPTSPRHRDREGRHGHRHSAADAGKIRQLHRADAEEYRSNREKQRGFHQGVIDDVDEAAGQSGLVGEPDTERDVADLRDRGVSQHALQIGLEHRDQRGDEHGRDRQRKDDFGDRQIAEVDRDAEDRKEVAHQQVDRDLGRGGGQEDRHPGRRIGVGVRQPGVERKQREFQADADGNEGQSRHDGARVAGPFRPEPRGDVDHVEAAGQQIEQAHADDVEGRPDRAHDQVLERGEQRAPVAAERDQHIGRERRDLEKNEGVEGVAGYHDPQQAGEAEQVHAVEPCLLSVLDLECDGASRERHDHRADRRDQHQHEAAEDVDPVLDAPGRRPAAEVIGDRAGRQHLPQHRAGDQRHQPAHRQRNREGRRRSGAGMPTSTAPSSGMTTCNAGRCGQTAFMCRGPSRKSRPPRWCRRPR